jgi:anti-anti-sigma regulatory factor
MLRKLAQVRLAGVSPGARGFGPSDHLCWAYEDHPDFHNRLLEFLADGLSLGQRVCYMAAGDVRSLLYDLRDLGGLDAGVADGAVLVQSLDDVYPDGLPFDERAQVKEYARQTDLARSDGFTGLRVASEATPLVRTPTQLDAFARYEHRVDRFMSEQPFAALCGYNRTELGAEPIAQIACMHPNTNAGTTQFRLHASMRAAASLGGEIDFKTRELFPLALERADLWPTGGELVIDATDLTFIDHRSLIVLGEFAASRGGIAVLRTANRAPARIVEVLGLTDVRVEQPR